MASMNKTKLLWSTAQENKKRTTKLSTMTDKELNSTGGINIQDNKELNKKQLNIIRSHGNLFKHRNKTQEKKREAMKYLSN